MTHYRRPSQSPLPVAAALIALAALTGCPSNSEEAQGRTGDPPQVSTGNPPPKKSTLKELPKIKVTSTAFAQGKPIPKKYTADGANVSPPLAWTALPKATEELALICDDPDAPRKEPWVHWVLYKIPANATGLPEDFAHKTPSKDRPIKAVEGVNSFKKTGYGGPAPPPGRPHRYYFKLYALDVKLKPEPGLDKVALLKKMKGHVLARGFLMGTYER